MSKRAAFRLVPTPFQRFRYWFGEKTRLARLELRFVRWLDRITYRFPAVLLLLFLCAVSFSLGYLVAWGIHS